MPKPSDWDDEKGTCPWGHQMTECMRWKSNGEHNGLQRYCIIHRLEKERERRRERREEREAIETRRQERLALHNSYLFGKPIGQDSTGNKITANITLTCGHVLEFKRAYIPLPATAYPGDMPCELCDEWQHVHEVDSVSELHPGMVFYPLSSEGILRVDKTPLSRPKFCTECGRRKEHKDSCRSKSTPLNDPNFKFSNSPEVPPSFARKIVLTPRLELETVNWMRKGSGFAKRAQEYTPYVSPKTRRY